MLMPPMGVARRPGRVAGRCVERVRVLVLLSLTRVVMVCGLALPNLGLHGRG